MQEVEKTFIGATRSHAIDSVLRSAARTGVEWQIKKMPPWWQFFSPFHVVCWAWDNSK